MSIHTFKRIWGDDYTFDTDDGGLTGRLRGWKVGVENGDYLILENGDGTTRYQVTSIKYYADPSDMFQADVKFAPRNS